jgi:hypothetical protein
VSTPGVLDVVSHVVDIAGESQRFGLAAVAAL